MSDFGLTWRPFREYLQIKNFFQKSACDFSTFIVPNCANWENCVTNEPNNQPIIINNTDLIGPGSRRSNNNNNNNNKKIAGRWIYLSQMFEYMKRSESKQLAGYIFACCIALVPSLYLLAGFAVQCLLAVSLSQLASTFGRYNQNLVTGHCYYVHEMKREETTSRLYFRMLYYNGAELAFIGWICGTEPIGSVAMPVSQYKKGSSSEYDSAWNQLRTPPQNLGTREWGDYWWFLTLS